MHHTQTIRCRRCRGDRTLICKTCRGDVFVKCSQCNGSGYLPCERCQGKGVIEISCNCDDPEKHRDSPGGPPAGM